MPQGCRWIAGRWRLGPSWGSAVPGGWAELGLGGPGGPAACGDSGPQVRGAAQGVVGQLGTAHRHGLGLEAAEQIAQRVEPIERVGTRATGAISPRRWCTR